MTIRIRGARTHNLKNVLARPAARQADRDHRPVRFGQVLAGFRHALRRGPAPLRGKPVGLRPPVPADDGEARRRPHRGPVAGDLHRAEVHLPQPALHRRHDHRDLRLPAPALRARRHAALPGPRPPAGGADRQPDGRRRCCPGRPTPAADGAGAGDPRAGKKGESFEDECARPAGAGLRPRPRRRPARRTRRHGAAEEGREARHRRGHRPPAHQARKQAAPGRELRDRAAPGRRPRAGRPLDMDGSREQVFSSALRLPGLRPPPCRSWNRACSPSTTRRAPARPATAWACRSVSSIPSAWSPSPS